MLDDVVKIRRFDKGEEIVSIRENETCEIDGLFLGFSQIQNIEIFRNKRKDRRRFSIIFETDGFRVNLSTDIIQASELFELANFIEKDDLERLKE